MNKHPVLDSITFEIISVDHKVSLYHDVLLLVLFT